MRDIPLPNGVVICDGRGLFRSPPATGVELDGLVIVSLKADGRVAPVGCEVAGVGDGGEGVAGVDEVVAGVDEVVVGGGAVVSDVGGVVIDVRPRPPRRPCGEVVGVDEAVDRDSMSSR